MRDSWWAETPGIAGGDVLGSPFRRTAALLVVTVTLLGAVAAALTNHATDHADSAGRDAQIATVRALSGRSGQSAEDWSLWGRSTDLDRLLGRSATAASYAFYGSGTPSELSDLEVASREDRWSELLERPALAGVDDFRRDWDTHVVTTHVEWRHEDVRAGALKELHANWEEKGRSYTTAIIFLAVAASLLGLAVALDGGARVYLVVPAVAVALIATVITLNAAARGVTELPDEALRHVAAAEAHHFVRDLEGALGHYDRAIAVAPGFARAYEGRSGARFAAGSAQDPRTAEYVSVTSTEALEASIADAETALALPGTRSAAFHANLGWSYFLAIRYEDAVEQTQIAAELQPNHPAIMANLGVIQLARGDASAATEAFEAALELTADRGRREERESLFAAMLTDLDLLPLRYPDLDEAVAAQKGRIVSAWAGDRLGDDPQPAPADGEVNGLELSTQASIVQLSFSYSGLPTGAAVTAVGYDRWGDDLWVVDPGVTTESRWELEPEGDATWDLDQAVCPIGDPLEHKVELYVGDRLLSTATVERSGAGESWSWSDEPVAGIGLCVPGSWEVETSAGRLVATGDDRWAMAEVDPAPPPADGVTAEEYEATVLDMMTTDETYERLEGYGVRTLLFDTPDERRSLRGSYTILDARGTDDQFIGIWASLGPDGALRTLILTAPAGEFDDLANELFYNSQFTLSPQSGLETRDRSPRTTG